MRLTQNKTYIEDLEVALEHVIGLEKLKEKKFLICVRILNLNNFNIFYKNSMIDTRMESKKYFNVIH